MSSIEKITITNLTKNYGKQRGVVDLTLDIHRGEIFGFLGPNGAGKTTTIRCLMNILVPDTGSILIDDTQVSRDHSELKENIGYLPGELFFPKGYTVKEMLDYMSSLKATPSDRREELVNRFKLDTSKKIQALSLGNKQKLGIVLSFMHDPDLLILDEPTSGLDPLFQQELYQLIEEEKAQGKTIFFSSHNLDEVQKICDRVAIIRNGELINLQDVHNLSESIPRTLTAVIGSSDTSPLDKAGLSYELESGTLTIKIKTKEELSSVLQILTNMDVNDISYPPASLEEYFMTYYNGA